MNIDYNQWLIDYKIEMDWEIYDCHEKDIFINTHAHERTPLAAYWTRQLCVCSGAMQIDVFHSSVQFVWSFSVWICIK